MYIDFEVVKACLDQLRAFHPFFGITFLVCKKGNLPVGRSVSFPINAGEEEFLRAHYKPDLGSKFFFQPFRTSSRLGGWLSPKYPYSGSQSTRTRGDFEKAFIHKKGTDQWGWSKNYVDVLRVKLDRDRSGRIPVFWLAAWLYRERNWGEDVQPTGIVQQFLSEFSITKAEQDKLFRVSIPELTIPVFSQVAYSDTQLLKLLAPAPDAKPQEGGTLRLLRIDGIGPSKSMTFGPAERLSIITGDNGLGKTFLLEMVWWSLTGHWAEQPAFPRLDVKKSEPSITFEIAAKNNFAKTTTIGYDWDAQRWPAPKGRPTIPGLIIYARVDGSFAVWDPVRHASAQGADQSPVLLFSRQQVLHGLEGRIEGLLRDWVRWQQGDPGVFDTFTSVLYRLSPPDMMPLTPGDPVRMPNEARPIPTLHHNYGLVPFVNESAGVKRIVTLAYLIVWAWNEHKIYSSIARKQPQERVVILIDEMEAHLHPRWQRVILPAVLGVTSILGRNIQPQMIVATHSPMVLASVETSFSDNTDKLFHLELTKDGVVTFKEVPFVRYGRIDRWLTSDLFELRQPRSREGEQAIELARSLFEKAKVTSEEILEAHKALSATLSSHDEFWSRWAYFAERKGVQL